MGALRGVRASAVSRRAGRLPTVVAAVAVAVSAVGISACQPVGGLDTAAIALTTDQAGTRLLEHDGVAVRWLSCTATVNDGRGSGASAGRAGASASPTRRSVATVDCQGRTKSGERITVAGKVTREIAGRCVRGDLTARVGGRTVFRVGVLGDCEARDTQRPTWSGEPRPTVTRTVHPTGTHPPGTDPPTTPPVTVTVTVTPDPPPAPSPTCDHDSDGRDMNGHDSDDKGGDDKGSHDRGGQGDDPVDIAGHEGRAGVGR